MKKCLGSQGQPCWSEGLLNAAASAGRPGQLELISGAGLSQGFSMLKLLGCRNSSAKLGWRRLRWGRGREERRVGEGEEPLARGSWRDVGKGCGGRGLGVGSSASGKSEQAPERKELGLLLPHLL